MKIEENYEFHNVAQMTFAAGRVEKDLGNGWIVVNFVTKRRFVDPMPSRLWTRLAVEAEASLFSDSEVSVDPEIPRQLQAKSQYTNALLCIKRQHLTA